MRTLIKRPGKAAAVRRSVDAMQDALRFDQRPGVFEATRGLRRLSVIGKRSNHRTGEWDVLVLVQQQGGGTAELLLTPDEALRAAHDLAQMAGVCAYAGKCPPECPDFCPTDPLHEGVPVRPTAPLHEGVPVCPTAVLHEGVPVRPTAPLHEGDPVCPTASLHEGGE